jgi:hypothetical protein
MLRSNISCIFCCTMIRYETLACVDVVWCGVWTKSSLVQWHVPTVPRGQEGPCALLAKAFAVHGSMQRSSFCFEEEKIHLVLGRIFCSMGLDLLDNQQVASSILKHCHNINHHRSGTPVVAIQVIIVYSRQSLTNPGHIVS